MARRRGCPRSGGGRTFLPGTALRGAQHRSGGRLFVNAADVGPVLLRRIVRPGAQAVSARSCAARARRARPRMIWSKLQARIFSLSPARTFVFSRRSGGPNW